MWTEVADGWRLCSPCSKFLQSAFSPEVAAWRYVLADSLISDAEAQVLHARYGSPFYGARRDTRADDPGNDSRWLHLPDFERAKAAKIIDEHRANTGLSVNASGLGCGWCGARHSFGGWLQSALRTTDGRDWPICASDRDLYLRAGAPMFGGMDGARWHLLGSAIGYTKQGRPAAAPRSATMTFDLRCFAELHPAGHEGTDEPWAYAAEVLPAIRMRLAREFPKVGTPAELAEIRRERELADMDAALERARQARRVSVLG